MAESSLQLNEKRWFRRQWSWHGLISALVVAGAGAGLLTIFGDHTILAAWLVIAAIGYALGFAGANRAGVLLWVVAAAMLSAAVWMPCHHTLFAPDILLALAGFVLALPASVVFLVASIRNRRRCAENCAGCMLVLFTVLIFLVPGSYAENVL